MSSAWSLTRANPSARLEIHPDADHRFSAPAWQGWLVDRVVGFLTDRLLSGGGRPRVEPP